MEINGTWQELKKRLLIREAQRWEGIKEVGGDNKGQVVEMLQKAVDGKAQGEPWCLGFAQFCIQQIDLEFDAIMMCSSNHANLPATEHCMTLWNGVDHIKQTQTPEPGCLVVWAFGDTGNGHIGIVTEVNGDTFKTIEGNTSDGAGINREGNGVYSRERKLTSGENFKIKGFIKPWG